MRFQRKVRGSTLTVGASPTVSSFLGPGARAALGRGTMDLQQQIAALAAVGAAPAPRPYECRLQAACGAASPCMLPRVTDVSLRPSCVCADALRVVVGLFLPRVQYHKQAGHRLDRALPAAEVRAPLRVRRDRLRCVPAAARAICPAGVPADGGG